MQEDAVKKLIASLKCGFCGKSYHEAGIDIIEHEDEVWFLRVLCPACHVRSLVAAIIREEPARQAGLTEADTERFRDAEAIGEEDVLEMRKFLKTFNGDLAALFR